MKRSLFTNVLLGGLMLMSAGAAKYLTPTIHMSEVRPMPKLETIIPVQFDGWLEEKNNGAGVVDPQIQSELKRIYTQILSRTYVNQAGERIMLSIAYGRDQSDTTQVHYPEVCYPAQGFQVSSNRAGLLATPKGPIQVKRLETHLESQRYEPVTYWTTVGDVVVNSRMDKKIAEMRYSLKGEIPDGLLFRVSSINRDSATAFRTQDDFVKSLLSALDPASKLRLMGIAE